MEIAFEVNGTATTVDVAPDALFVDILRDHLGLTGVKIGCDSTSCGACTVLLNGLAVKSCTMLAVQLSGAQIETIEGLAVDGELHPVQAAFSSLHALQCGFCTPGMIMSAVALLADQPDPTANDIRHAIEGNLCRCTGYFNIVRAIEHAGAVLRGDAPQSGVAEHHN
ncbi:MAG: (2Fe-2S)-binding protein [Acidimicrobiia bacterium]|nr:(2Fe-2S)-binding protein [Acidimicrobiia bacterium]